MMKKIVFIGNALDNIKNFAPEAKREAGHQLDRIQRGKEPLDWKPMHSIASGVREIRFRDRNGIYRVIYIAKHEKVVYVLHAFQKKTQKTSRLDIEIAKQAFKKILEERKR